METDETEFVEDGDEIGVELCCCCVEPVAPGANFCNGCGAPLNFFATALPYQRILAEGFFCRRAIYEPRSLLTVVGIWVLFSGYVAGGLFYFLELWRGFRDPKFFWDYWESAVVAGGAFGMSWIGIAALVLVTRNYVRYLRSEGEGSGQLAE